MSLLLRPALGIDLGGTKIEAVLFAPDGSELWRRRSATPAGSYDGTVTALADAVAAARQAVGGQAADRQALSIGVGSPGTRTASGLMKNCNSTCLNGRPLQRDI